MFEFMKKRYSNMNEKTRSEVIDWTRTWDNDQCQRCGVTFKQLDEDAQIKEEMTGKTRILPVFTVDHKDGDSSHNDGYIEVDDQNKPIAYGSNAKPIKQVWHKFGNCRRLCWACNRIAGHQQRRSFGSERTTQEKQDRVNNEQRFVLEAETQINERGHVCYRAICKAGKNICDSSEITCGRYLDTEIKTPENPKGNFFKFAHKCEGQFCNGSHVCWVGAKPDVIIEEERQQLEREWRMEYDLSRWEGKTDSDGKPLYTHEEIIRQWQGWGSKEWEPLEQYINKRLKTTW